MSCNKETEKRQQSIFFAGFLSLALLAAIAFIVLYQRENSQVRVESLESFPVGDPSEIIYEVSGEEIYDDRGTHLIMGWAVKPGKVYSFYNYGNDAYRERVYNNMYLGCTDGNDVFILPTKLSKRDDVDALINDGIDYAYCGFSSLLPAGIKEQMNSFVLIWQNQDGTKELFYLNEDGKA